MRRRYIIALLAVAVFAVFTLGALRSTLTPYVSFAQAREMKSTVQVRGVLAGDKIIVGDSGKAIKFLLRDENGETVPVVYSGAKPDGLEQAAGVVAVGKYRDGQFVAEKLLVKCPSKYQRSVNR